MESILFLKGASFSIKPKNEIQHNECIKLLLKNGWKLHEEYRFNPNALGLRVYYDLDIMNISVDALEMFSVDIYLAEEFLLKYLSSGDDMAASANISGSYKPIRQHWYDDVHIMD